MICIGVSDGVRCRPEMRGTVTVMVCTPKALYGRLFRRETAAATRVHAHRRQPTCAHCDRTSISTTISHIQHDTLSRDHAHLIAATKTCGAGFQSGAERDCKSGRHGIHFVVLPERWPLRARFRGEAKRSAARTRFRRCASTATIFPSRRYPSRRFLRPCKLRPASPRGKHTRVEEFAVSSSASQPLPLRHGGIRVRWSE